MLKTRDTACPFFRVIEIEQKKAIDKISLVFLEKDSTLFGKRLYTFWKMNAIFQKITFKFSAKKQTILVCI